MLSFIYLLQAYSNNQNTGRPGYGRDYREREKTCSIKVCSCDLCLTSMETETYYVKYNLFIFCRFRFRINALLCLKLYQLKKAEASKLKRALDEHNKVK